MYRRHAIRGPLAEFFGTAILVIFGAGAGAAATLNANPNVSSTPKGVRTLPRLQVALLPVANARIHPPGLSLCQLRMGCW